MLKAATYTTVSDAVIRSGATQLTVDALSSWVDDGEIVARASPHDQVKRPPSFHLGHRQVLEWDTGMGHRQMWKVLHYNDPVS